MNACVCEFTSEQLYNYSKFEKVRRSGRFEMDEPGAQIATGLNPTDYLFVLNNYTALRSWYKQEH